MSPRKTPPSGNSHTATEPRVIHCSSFSAPDSTFSGLLACALGSLLFCLNASAAERIPWNTSRVHGSPEPPPPYVVERIHPGLTFKKPLDLAPLPGTDRLVVLEEGGRLFSFIPSQTTTEPDFFGQVSDFHPEAVRSFAFTFHPQFAKNRFIFLWAGMDGKGEALRPDGTHIVRFNVSSDNPPRIDPASARIIVTWPGGGHNGGNMRFGPDGMLYVSTGDGTPPDPPDSLATGQDISDLLSSVLRLDVDHPPAGKPYGIPADNPFTAIPKARGEVWAYGLRNPWRMSFNPKNGDLFVGDVGWELWEMVYRIERGGNYGWSITEGSKQDVRPDRAPGPTQILPPLVAHSHEEAASITGGEFYHGERLPALKGAYLYADWQMGTFWSLRTEGGKVTEHREIARSSLMPAGFGLGHDGEWIILDHSGGGLWRLEHNPVHGRSPDFPLKLSQTGLFSDTAAQIPAAGVQPYEVIAPRWADHATAQRWAAFPGQTGVTVATESKGVMLRGRWAFPAGAVLAKTYSLEMERGNPASRRKIETQILHFDGNLWGNYTYRWNDTQTDADLVPKQGAETTFTIRDKTAPGGESRQPWRFFSRSECARCHTLMNDFAQGFTAAQLHRTTPGAEGNQLDVLTRQGFTPADPRLADPYDPSASLIIRARSYLHSNCGVCHRFNSGGGVPSRMDIDTPLKDAALLNSKPLQGDLGLPDARVVAGGDPARSVLLLRMATAGRGHMPYLGAQLLDDRGILLLRDWIASTPPEPPKSLAPETLKQREMEETALAHFIAGGTEHLKSLLSTNSGSLRLLLALLDGKLDGKLRELAITQGSAQTDPLRRDLFERFLPESQRRKVLGPGFQTAPLLARKGDSTRGQGVFTSTCGACHRAGNSGVDFGPDLSRISTKWNRFALLEHIMRPSKIVDPQWQLVSVTLNDGSTKAGFVAARDGSGLTLRMPGGVTEKLSAGEIAQTTKGPAAISTMPEGLLENLTVQEAADLLEYLQTLR
jgi:putative heme-binding domain-containing protein